MQRFPVVLLTLRNDWFAIVKIKAYLQQKSVGQNEKHYFSKIKVCLHNAKFKAKMKNITLMKLPKVIVSV